MNLWFIELHAQLKMIEAAQCLNINEFDEFDDIIYIFSTVLIPHLLLITVTSSIHIPFYCKIRKTNCELRPESACCQHLSSTTTSTTTAATINTSSAATGERVTTLASMDSTEMTKGQENENIQSAPYEEVFEAEPSEIDEVFLKVSGENIEV